MKHAAIFIVSAIVVWTASCVCAEAKEPGYVVTWSEPEDLDGFENPNGQPAHVAGGGCPGGFMKATRAGGVNVTVKPLPFLRRDWGKTFGTGPGTISFHVKALSDHSIPAIIFSLSDGGSLFRYVISARQTKANGWVRYSMPWQATWDAARAREHGWQPNRDIASWERVMANPIYSCFDVLGEGGSGGDQTVGIDNFCVEAGEVIDLDFRKYAFEFGEYVTKLTAGGTPAMSLGMPVWNRTGKKRTIRVRCLAADGSEGAASKAVTILDDGTYVMFMERLEAPDIYHRGSRIYYKTGRPTAREVVVSDAASGETLASIEVSEPAEHMALDVAVDSPWHPGMSGEATAAVSLKVTLGLDAEQLKKGTLEAALVLRDSGSIAASRAVQSPQKKTAVRFSTENVPWGMYEARVGFKDAAGIELLSAHAPSPVLPGGRHGLKVLNNFVTELMNARERGLLNADRLDFMNPRDGWCFFSLRGDAEVRLDGFDAPVLPATWPEPDEAMRWLEAGRHTLTIGRRSGGKLEELVVRAIPRLCFDYYDARPYIAPHVKFDWEYLSRHVLPHLNVMISAAGVPGPEHVKLWKGTGRSWIHETHRPDVLGIKLDPDDPAAVDKIYELWTSSPGYQDPLMGGAICDEFGSQDTPIYDVYRRAVKRLNADFPGRTFSPYIGGPLYDLNRSGKFAMAALEGGGYVAPEHYLVEQPDEKSARWWIESQIMEKIAGWQKTIPGVNPRVMVVLGYMSALQENLDAYPGTDFNVYMDMQMRAMATDPRCFGLGGVLWYRSSLADPEYVRTAARLFRHYCIEGKTGPLTSDPYELAHIKNPDFSNGTDGWTTKPAGEDSVWTGAYPGLGNFIERRYIWDSKVGDTYLVMRRSEKRPNSVRQGVKGLKPGRLYSFRMITGDHGDLASGVSAEKVHAVAVQIENAEMLPGEENNYQLPCPMGTWNKTEKFDGASNPFWMNYHWRVFRARSETATLTLSDWKDPDTPGGPPGQEIFYNFIQIQPYEAPSIM